MMQVDKPEEARFRGQSQRVEADVLPHQSDKLRVRLQRYHEKLGWYTASSMIIPLTLLPMLEEALESLEARHLSEEASGKVIPFPIN